MISQGRILLLDSSLLMLPVSGKRVRINLEDSLRRVSEGMRLAVLESTIKELNWLKNSRKGKKRLAADFALEFIRRMKIPIIPVDPIIEKKVKNFAKEKKGWEVSDEILLRMAEKLNAAVATTDMALKNRLQEVGIPVYYLRGKKWIYVSRESV
ncbi:MAG: type II toxin-antitoxin system VapC family toxin [Candidatus Njordarchaeales archaeon]